MNRNRTFCIVLCLAACAVLPAPGIAREGTGGDWDALRVEAASLGAEWGELLDACRAGGWSEEAAGEVLRAARAAQGGGAPLEPLRAKVREGLAKQVDGDTVAAAATRRAGLLLRGRTLVAGAGYDPASGAGEDLGIAVGRALESGVPEPAVDAALQRGGGRYAGRVASVIEAGEALHLAGMSPETVQDLMTDYVHRGLRRTEVLRASRFAVRRHEAGVSGSRLREEMWGGAAHRHGRAGEPSSPGGGPEAGWQDAGQRPVQGPRMGDAPGAPADAGPNGSGRESAPVAGGPAGEGSGRGPGGADTAPAQRGRP